jgi:hypothetical protein
MDGQTVVIGGLIRREDIKIERKVPWLGDLPYLGAAFRFRGQNKLKRELLILLTPQVIRSPCDGTGQRILAEEAAKMDWNPRHVDEVHRPLGVEPFGPGGLLPDNNIVPAFPSPKPAAPEKSLPAPKKAKTPPEETPESKGPLMLPPPDVLNPRVSAALQF